MLSQSPPVAIVLQFTNGYLIKFFQDDNLCVNVGKNFATVSALVLCKRISAIMELYLLVEEFLQGNFLPNLPNHSSKDALNFLTLFGEG